MGHEFQGDNRAEVPATVDEVWTAIATGPGIESWFMGHGEVTDTRVTLDCGVFRMDHDITTSEPKARFAFAAPTAADGRFIAYEFLIEGRGQGSTVVRMVTSGFLPGDDWEAEYEAMTLGGALFWSTLVEYLHHFPGSTATPVTAFGPVVTDWVDGWARVRRELGLGDDVHEGDRVTATLHGLPPIDGVVYFGNPHTLGIRTDGAMYRFVQGFFGPLMVSHHLFDTTLATTTTEAAWADWLNQVFA